MEGSEIEAKEVVPASRKLGKSDAEELFKSASRVIVCKGKLVEEWKPSGKIDADGVAKMLGPTGNLRAPTIRKGKTLVIGYNDDIFEEVFGR